MMAALAPACVQSTKCFHISNWPLAATTDPFKSYDLLTQALPIHQALYYS